MAKFEFWKAKRKQEESEQSPWSYERYPADTTRSSLFSAEDEWDVTQSKPVFTQAPIHSVTRPRSYEEFLRARGGAVGGAGGQGRYYDSPYGAGRRYYEEGEDAGTTGLPMHRLMQILGAVALTGILYFTFHSESPTASRVQAYVTQHLTNDSNLTGLTAWWQSNISDKVAVPAMSTSTGTVTDPAPEAKFALVLPVQGAKVKNAYDGKEQQGITFTAALGADVHAAAKGTVEKIEKGTGDEYSVTINHGGTNGRTVYSHLASVDVAANDAVASDQKIGALAKKGTATLFFAYQNDGAYLDPNDLLNASTTGQTSAPTTPTPAAPATEKPANTSGSSSTKAPGGA
ncbi:M23 family metallopeptidase [Tumebacillus permanentifrigoris]|uniref:Peptidase M23-like protein n=1 Tax=Tumebacillus permanentifrigoris TaxID=378543 RepID=A0A316D861_9BACL|nr:M23 family metallopeptidase [Tumebacillus permanentifrigoris]PWK06270.1 peptidase M23-like protein [Tumebacillus permanentifrigoris]